MDSPRDSTTTSHVVTHSRQATLLCSILVLVLTGLPGCMLTPGGTQGAVDIELAVGETADGNLNDGQGLRATVLVEGGHIYQIRASLGPAATDSTGTAEITGTLSGEPLEEAIEFPIESLFRGVVTASSGISSFIPVSDGEVTIELAYDSQDGTEDESALDRIRAFISGEMRAKYEVLITDLGLDDHGISPADAVTLVIGLAGERSGTLKPGEEADYFIFEVQEGRTYLLTVESTDSVEVTSGVEDRFGQVNFGVRTAGGLLLETSASAGTPGTAEFTAPATEDVLLQLSVSAAATSVTDIQYAISVIETVAEDE